MNTIDAIQTLIEEHENLDRNRPDKEKILKALDLGIEALEYRRTSEELTKKISALFTYLVLEGEEVKRNYVKGGKGD